MTSGLDEAGGRRVLRSLGTCSLSYSQSRRHKCGKFWMRFYSLFFNVIERILIPFLVELHLALFRKLKKVGYQITSFLDNFTGIMVAAIRSTKILIEHWPKHFF